MFTANVLLHVSGNTFVSLAKEAVSPGIPSNTEPISAFNFSAGQCVHGQTIHNVVLF